MRNQRMSVGAKTKPLAEVVAIVHQLRAEGKKIVLGHGVFDLMHIGHMHYLEQAADYGDVLIVSVVDDKFVHKGPNRPAFSEAVRRRSVASLGCVDFVVPCCEIGPYEIITTLKPDVYVRAEDVLPLLDDPASGLNKDKEILDSVGGQMVFVESIPLVHSTPLINRYFPANPPEVLTFLEDFKKKHNCRQVVESLKSLRDLKVLLIGEAIVDEYCYVAPLPGTPSKSPVVAAEFREKEIFAGGVLACANHVAGLCGQVDVVTYLGEADSREEFIRGKLKPNVRPTFFHCPNRPTITKTRFIDPASFTKMFELYTLGRGYLPSELETRIRLYMEEHLPVYDLVIVTDYGHGFLSSALISTLVDRARFLAVNTQTNAGNIGFNYVTKYPKANYVCVDEKEARLAVHDDTSPMCEVARKVRENVQAGMLVVTLGQRGSIFFDEDKVFKSMPPFAAHVVDTVGAGDAFLAFSGVCAAGGLPNDLTAFVGNVAGSLAVGTIGNRSAVSPDDFFRYLKYLLD